MGLLTSEAIIQTFGAEYLRAVSLSYLFCGISQMYLCVMKNTGYATRSAMISSVCVVINIVLNAILIFGLLGNPAMGIKGAAYATVITRLVEMVWGFIVPVGLIAAFVLHLPVLWVYFLITLDETVKLPAFWRHYRKYQWVKNITR